MYQYNLNRTKKITVKPKTNFAFKYICKFLFVIKFDF